MAVRLGKFDYRNHLALLAEVFEDNSETMVGEARYVIDDHDSATCEFALAVADNWQRCGIGRALLKQLEREVKLEKQLSARGELPNLQPLAA